MQSIWSFNIMQNAYIENKDTLPTLVVSSTISQKFEKALEISSPAFTDPLLPFATFLPGDAQLLQ